MAKVLVIKARSTEAVPPEERFDVLKLPADHGTLRKTLLGMLGVDRGLRAQHPEWVWQGCDRPLGVSGCKAWTVGIPLSFLRRKNPWIGRTLTVPPWGETLLEYSDEATALAVAWQLFKGQCLSTTAPSALGAIGV